MFDEEDFKIQIPNPNYQIPTSDFKLNTMSDMRYAISV